MARTPEGLAAVRPIRNPAELKRIAGEIEERTKAKRARLATKQEYIDAQVKIGRVRGRQRRQAEATVRLEIKERVKAQSRGSIDDRLRQVAESTSDTDSL